MTPDDPLYSILDYILNRATSAELEAIGEALKRRQQPRKGLGGISPRGMAERVAKTVGEQLGGMLDVNQMARKIVADLIRAKEPGIGERELAVLLDNWLPQSGKKRDQTPPDVMITMVSQYVDAHRGTLPPEQARQLPQDWQKRYWESFTPELRTLIEGFLGGRVDEVEFWSKVIAGVGD